MRQSKYLNFILTINALLLAALVWSVAVNQPLLAGEAHATTPQSRTKKARTPGGIPNSSQQRNEMVVAMREMKASMDSTRKLLESGNVRVQVTNLRDLNK